MSLAFVHGGPTLTTVKVDAYNAELQDAINASELR